MEAVLQTRHEVGTLFHFERSRLNQLFTEAVKYPVVLVCAGAGYGKTSAVHDFSQHYQTSTAWIQLSERDNVGARFWENFTHTMTRINAPFARAVTKLDFPDTADKVNQYISLSRKLMEIKQQIIVMDDFHLIENPSVINFIECGLLNVPPGTSVFLISRSTPRINTAGLLSKSRIFSITENDLKFTENELAQYLRQQEILIQSNSLRDIIQDTGGWAFAIDLIVRSYDKAPGYEGYLRNAMKMNIFQHMETEIWDKIPKRLQNFLIRLSLIDHLSIDLISLLAGGDDELIAELERQSAFVRRDCYINAYLIHHLFLEFLRQKQDLLPEKEKLETYETAGDWCNKNSFKIDALSYYEKTGDYQSIVSIFFDLPPQVPHDIAHYAMRIFNRAPGAVFDRVDLLAVMHVRVVISLGLWREASKLMEYYETKYLKRPPNDPLRNHTLGGIYYCRGILGRLMCTVDDRYDFDSYYARLDECLSKFPINPGPLTNFTAGPWISLVGSSREGAPEEYISALASSVNHVSHCLNGAMTGIDDLARGELKFYQDDMPNAESFIVQAMENAGKHKQFEIIFRALFYILRIAVSQGNYTKAAQALKDMESSLNENEYTNRYINYDIALAWYYNFVCQPDLFPEWLKEKLAPYSHVSFIENFGNQMKVHYYYLTKKYPLVLAYMQEQRQRESILYGRVEMLAMEACIHLKMKNKVKAFEVLAEAYETGQPNCILMPFIEMGKDMRTLSASALRESGARIPQAWLETVNRKATTYAKRQSHIIAEYKQASGQSSVLSFSPRQLEVLEDLSHGLSRTEIAVSRGLSVNTVKMVINMIYAKSGAGNLADLIRIAVERKIV